MKAELRQLIPVEETDIYEMALEIGKGENGFVNGICKYWIKLA